LRRWARADVDDWRSTLLLLSTSDRFSELGIATTTATDDRTEPPIRIQIRRPGTADHHRTTTTTTTTNSTGAPSRACRDRGGESVFDRRRHRKRFAVTSSRARPTPAAELLLRAIIFSVYPAVRKRRRS